jgi:hypothetical protein
MLRAKIFSHATLHTRAIDVSICKQCFSKSLYTHISVNIFEYLVNYSAVFIQQFYTKLVEAMWYIIYFMSYSDLTVKSFRAKLSIFSLHYPC